MKKVKSHSEGHQYHTTQSERSWLALRRFSSSSSWAEKLLAYRNSESTSEVIQEEEDDSDQDTITTGVEYQRDQEAEDMNMLQGQVDEVVRDFSNLSSFYPPGKARYTRKVARVDGVRGENEDREGIRSLHQREVTPLFIRKRTSTSYNKREFSLHSPHFTFKDLESALSTSPDQSMNIHTPAFRVGQHEEKPLPPSPTSTYSQDSVDEDIEWTTQPKSYWSDDSDSSEDEGDMTVTQERISRKSQGNNSEEMQISQRVLSTWKGLRSRKMSVPNLKFKSDHQCSQDKDSPPPKLKHVPSIPSIRTYPPSASGKHSSMPRPSFQRMSSSSSFNQKRVNLSEIHISSPKEWRGLRDL